jgi:hypothetical protein
VPNSTIEDNKSNFSRSGSTQDLMWHVYQLLCVLLQQNMNKPSGMAANLILNSNAKWILDSGATDHMTGNKKLLYNFKKYETSQYVTVANGGKMKILGYGSINLFSKEILNILFV